MSATIERRGVKIITFGQISEFTGSNELVTTKFKDTDALKEWLFKKYPQLKTMNFFVAVNRKIIKGNVHLSDNCEVALLPPFSGG
jgi:molybdopterin converting factor small subunit